MKPNYPLVHSAPRCAQELANMPLEMQVKVLAELRSLSTGGLLGKKKFSVLSAEERAGYLEEALQDYDKATAYTVHGVAVPVRTADDEKNQEGWNAFASHIEQALGDLAREDCRQISTQHLDGGVLVIGFKPPREQPDPFASASRVVAAPISQLVGGPGEVGQALTRLMHELSAMNAHGHSAATKEVEEAIGKFFQDKPVPYLQEAIVRVEGVAQSMEKDAVPKAVSMWTLPFLQKILSVLKNRVTLQLC